MVNESVTLQSTSFELATFGEVLYAFSALRSTSGRRRGMRAAHELLPWESMPGAVPECDPRPEPPRAVVTAPPRVDHAPQAHLPKARRTSGRCQCGECRTCQENARWERIFQEKFANSDYYHRDIRIRYASPLSSM
ncbi:MAG TPA: hypothetical protein VMG35_04160 [Bryobacteraceae bacterium]|nr:hypothetical protein [Bryobacteraceae bacterium]